MGTTTRAEARRTVRTMEASPPPDPLLAIAREAAALVFGSPGTRHFTLRYWDSGFSEPAQDPDPRFTLIFTHPGTLRRMLLPPSQLRLAEAFIFDDYDVEGDLEAATLLGPEVRERLASAPALARLTKLLLQLPTEGRQRSRNARRSLHTGLRHTPERDAAAIRAHYDVGNDFYALWLDQEMVYSCAYFRRPEMTLDEAQVAKLEHICRKLRLQPGERLLDIGCGWGGLMRHAAANYGVVARGVTLSPSQAAFATARIEAEGLSEQCRVDVLDYRALPETEPWDKIVSVGMCEHVGRSHLPEYFGKVYSLLRPGGLFLNHCITKDREVRGGARWMPWRDGDFTKKYVFPDGELEPSDVLLHDGRVAGFETRDVESLREHYALTLRRWVRRLEAHRDEAIAMTNDITFRIWRLYMAGAAGGFASGRLNLHQMLHAKPGPRGQIPTLPMTRDDLVADGGDLQPKC